MKKYLKTISKRIRYFRRQSQVKVLGPFKRSVIWLQGCPFKCKGCIAPESRSPEGGTETTISEMTDWILNQNNTEGITLSGGEPMEQAKSLIKLINRIRKNKNPGVVCYTGYTLEYLRENGTIHQNRLLDKIDLLIDGPYNRDEHKNLLWRGSANQRLIFLTDRYNGIIRHLTDKTDKSAGLEFSVENGVFSFAGIPVKPDFYKEFRKNMADKHGVIMK